MYPQLIENPGGIPVNTYGMFMLLAFCCSFLLVQWRAPKVGIDPDRLPGVYVAAGIGGIIGARVLYAVAVEWKELLANPAHLFSMSGVAVYGGVVGGALAVLAVARPLSIPIWKLADIAGPSVLIGMSVGRLGCFFAGCCHGAPAPAGGTPLLPEGLLGGNLHLLSSPPFLTATFDGGVSRLLHQPLYPTQLWSFALLGLLCATLVAKWRSRAFDGQVAALTLIVEPPVRIFVESFRADERGYSLTFPAPPWVADLFPGLASAGSTPDAAIVGLTTSQTIALAGIALGVAIYALRRNAGVAPEKVIVHDQMM